MLFDGVVFPGQGTQFLQMGKDFVTKYREAKEIFNIAQDVLACDLYDICQNNNELLHNTEYTQPCILTVEIAMFKVLSKNYNLMPKFFAGHSLGEYAALVASEVIPFDIAIQLVKFRGKLMQAALPVVDPTNPGSMTAIISDQLPINQLQNIIAAYNVDLANDNSSQQVVLSGYRSDLNAAIAKIQATWPDQTIRIVDLPVSSAFHSRYMQTILEPFYNYLSSFKASFNLKKLPMVISNYFGKFYVKPDLELLLEGLTKQISGSVKWRENMEHLLQCTRSIVEIGPATPLRGFFNTLGIKIHSISSTKQLTKIFEPSI